MAAGLGLWLGDKTGDGDHLSEGLATQVVGFLNLAGKRRRSNDNEKRMSIEPAWKPNPPKLRQNLLNVPASAFVSLVQLKHWNGDRRTGPSP